MYVSPLLLPLLVLLSLPAWAQRGEAGTDFHREQWPARWVQVPGVERLDYSVSLLRKQFELADLPDAFPVYVSGDNQYALYLNDSLIARGPAKHDLAHWNYDSLDLAPYLQAGTNTLAARVYHMGPYRQEAQITHVPGFILQGVTAAAKIANTDDSWRGAVDSSYRPLTISPRWSQAGEVRLPGYYVAGPGEIIDFAQRIEGWQRAGFNDSDWPALREITPGTPRFTVGLDAGTSWRLVPSPLPQLGYTPERLAAVRRAEGVEVPTGFLSGTAPLTVPPRTTATLLLDQGYLTNAYPTLTFSGGAGATLSVTYAEALYRPDGTKGHRDSIGGKVMIGRKDSIIADGAQLRQFTPLMYRTYRYVKLRVTTGEEALMIDDVSAMAVGYPFVRRAQLSSRDPALVTLLDVGWRTARLCAMDTYMDCPFWEQLQYIGDTRIQALVSLYVGGDDRLVKNALDLMDHSRQPDGVTLSRYPTVNGQIIAPFSLWYIGMLHDYMMYGSDRDFVQNKLMGMRQVLDYFSQFQAADGSLRDLPNWSFSDWVDDWGRGIPPIGSDGYSAVLDLQLLRAYQHAAGLERELGLEAFAGVYGQRAEQLATTIREKYYDPERGLFRDTTGVGGSYSQHTNALAIITDVVPAASQRELAERLLTEELTPASIYFRYYLHRALVKAGLGDDYPNWLGIWRDHLASGLTTWAEDTDANTTRSDCHAWGSSPNIEYFRTVLGIDSASPHFRRVRIAPHLGGVGSIGGEMPHPAGTIRVDYRLTDGGLDATVELPEGVTGELVWRGSSYSLAGGTNELADLR